MFKNYLKISIRSLLKYKLNSLVNIIGLSTAICAALIIYLFSDSELNHNSLFSKSERIYQVYKERKIPTGTQIVRDTWFPMAEALKNDYPSIEDAIHIWDDEDWIRVGDRKFKEEIIWASANIFEVFDYPIVKGSVTGMFNDPFSVVISAEIAKKYFGDDDPIGKIITRDFETDYKIVGVLDALPKNITYRPQLIFSTSSIKSIDRLKENWGGSWLYTYVLLNEKEIPATLEAKLPDFVSKIFSAEDAERMKLKLTPLLNLNNEENNTNVYAYILLAAAFSIILIAIINYTNLTTARSFERARESGLRKVLGATRSNLIKQQFIESLILASISSLVAIGLAELLLPYFNLYFDLSLSANYFSDPFILPGIIFLTLVVSLLASFYPIFVLSRFHPVDTLKGQLKSNPSKIGFRNALVVFQFIVSISLIVCVSVMRDQISYMKNADLNFKKDNVLAIRVEASDFKDSDSGIQKITALKNELSQLPEVSSITYSTHVPGSWAGWHTFVYPDDRPADQRLRHKMSYIDENYFETYGIEFLEGSNFEKEKVAEAEMSVIVNEAALKDIGWNSKDDGMLNFGEHKIKILGVVKSYNFASLTDDVFPVIHAYRSSEEKVHNFLSLKLNSKDIQASLGKIQNVWANFDSGLPLNYFFVDERFQELYSAQERLESVGIIFSIIGIIIACLGLFALSSLLIAHKTKEIGIRKTLGASITNISFNFVKRFLVYVSVAFCISVPLVIYLMGKWLEDFAYKTSISPITIIIGGILVMLIALATVSYNTIKAAVINPAVSLRNE